MRSDVGAPNLHLIAAVARNNVIGRDGDLPWRLPDELKHFRRLTMGQIVLMGRKTYESLPKRLDGRDMWVLSRKADFSAEGIRVFADLQQALAAAGARPVFVIGGASLYTACLPLASDLHLTHVAASPEGDTHFPALDLAQWTQLAAEQHPADERHAHAFCMAHYRRL